MESIKQNQATTNQLDFLSSLFEARMTRDSGDQKVLTFTDCAERLYLTLLILQLLNQYPTYRQIATRYARETKHSNYDRFRMYSTDLYNFVYFVTGDEEAINKLKDPKSAMEMRKKSSFPTMAFNRYLGALQQGLIAPSIMQVFLNIETGLKIRNAMPAPINTAPSSVVRSLNLSIINFLTIRILLRYVCLQCFS